MEVDFETLPPYARYKLMSSLIVPRPITLVTTVSATGVVNAAPFSLFNMIGEDPPLLLLSISRGADGQMKDTSRNILERGEFVAHIADEAMATALHRCGAALPADVSEIDANDLSVLPSTAVAPPRIAQAPVAFECVLAEVSETGHRHIFIGRILRLHAREGLLDLDRHHVRLDGYLPVGRLGSTLYVRTRDRFTPED